MNNPDIFKIYSTQELIYTLNNLQLSNELRLSMKNELSKRYSIEDELNRNTLKNIPVSEHLEDLTMFYSKSVSNSVEKSEVVIVNIK